MVLLVSKKNQTGGVFFPRFFSHHTFFLTTVWSLLYFQWKQCNANPYLARMWNNMFATPEGCYRPLRYPRSWYASSHHYCLISWLCAWRPVLHLTFLKVRQTVHAQQPRGNEVRGKVFTLVSGVCVHTYVAVLLLFFFFPEECMAPLMGNFSLVWHAARQIYYINHEAALQRYRHEKIPIRICRWNKYIFWYIF